MAVELINRAVDGLFINSQRRTKPCQHQCGGTEHGVNLHRQMATVCGRLVQTVGFQQIFKSVCFDKLGFVLSFSLFALSSLSVMAGNGAVHDTKEVGVVDVR